MPKILTSTFNKLNITATFKTNNSPLKILRHRKPIPVEKKSGIYKLSCNDCNSFYIGQTGRGFLKLFKEHTPKRHLNNLTLLNNIKSNFARHLILHNHNYTEFKSNLILLHVCNKGRYMDAIEEFEIYKAYNNINSRDFILNDHLNFKSNPLYDTALNLLSRNHSDNNSVSDRLRRGAHHLESE